MYVRTYVKLFSLSGIVLYIILGVNAIFRVDVRNLTEDSASLICELPCFSPDLRCVISNITTNNMIVNVASTNGHIIGSLMTYSYPTQIITLNCLNSDTTYNYCVIATNITNMMTVGVPVCGNFTTMTIISDNNSTCLQGGCVYNYVFLHNVLVHT